MKVDIYRAKKSPGPHEKLYIFVPSGSDIEMLPTEIKEKTGGLVVEKTIDIQPGEKRIALDSDEALKNLSEKGFHEQGSKIEIEIRVGGQ
ncbi:YcgL domain-containing protein [Desulfobacter latus]|uniref:YcgL domain-containing protein n=1 Tax=Desulfobacter latus TaxID=2292 RepID=A0A850TB49_9BACT|nr:YcgL domain-containing protein [Desulfobacter latus]NWH06862.1 YcgL domain-containing protein [Desulfobacter latus]